MSQQAVQIPREEASALVCCIRRDVMNPPKEKTTRQRALLLTLNSAYY